jgi:capsule polysaccharide modification protein KpsS
MFASSLPLDEFWNAPGKVNRRAVEMYIRWLGANVQLNGTFYRPSFWQHESTEPGFRVRKQASRPG